MKLPLGMHAIAILTVCLFYKTDCYIMVAPSDTEILVNQSTYLNCSTSVLSPEVTWYRFRVGDPYRRYDVYDAGVIDRSYRERFFIEGDKTKGVFNLVITRVLADDAGKYECQDDGGIGDKRSAELVVLDSNGVVCQSNIPADEIIGPNDCGFEPTTLNLSCGVKFHGNNAPRLEWSIARGANISKFPQNSSFYNSTVDQATSNLTVKAELRLNGSSIICKTSGSASQQYAVKSVKVLYAFANRVAAEVTLNEKVSCSANSSQNCTYNWKWFEWKYYLNVSSNAELTVSREGWHRCNADCQFGKNTCTIEAMVIYVPSPSTGETGAVQDSKAAVVGLAVTVGFLLLFILISGIIIYLYWRKRFHRPTDVVDWRRNSPRQAERSMLKIEPIQIPDDESAG